MARPKKVIATFQSSDHALCAVTATSAVISIKETLINSEFPQHMDMLPFSMAYQPLKMKNKIKSNFILFVRCTRHKALHRMSM